MRCLHQKEFLVYRSAICTYYCMKQKFNFSSQCPKYNNIQIYDKSLLRTLKLCALLHFLASLYHENTRVKIYYGTLEENCTVIKNLQELTFKKIIKKNVDNFFHLANRYLQKKKIMDSLKK